MIFSYKTIDDRVFFTPYLDPAGLHAEMIKHPFGEVEVTGVSLIKGISLRQIRWWKGILLPALSKSNGDTIAQWEATLKLNVMPDEFKIEAIIVSGMAVNYIPSITKLSIIKTIELVEGSVAWLHDGTIHGDSYLWVELPDSAKRT